MIERGSPGVMDIIAERVGSKRPWHSRGDSYKVGLVIEGGAMRGIISGGMAKALGVLEVKDAFDAVYGVSAGAATGAYFLAKQADAISIYYEYINNTRFINYGRTPMVDIPYLVYNVMRGQKPLHARKVLESEIPLHIFVASAKDAKTVDFHEFYNEQHLFDALHWAMRIPIVAGMPARVGDKHYSDAGSTTGGISYTEALADGCTHMVVLMSDTPSQIVADLCGYAVLRSTYPKLARALSESSIHYSKTLHEMKKHTPQVQLVRTDKHVPIGLLETNAAKLKHAAGEGYSATIKTFEKHGMHV